MGDPKHADFKTAVAEQRVVTRYRPIGVFNDAQGITAVARTKTHQDARLDLERRAKKLPDRVAWAIRPDRSGRSTSPD